jgi:hypothetical protein
MKTVQLLLLLSLLIVSSYVHSQVVQDHQWIIGYSRSLEDPGPATVMDFTQHPVYVDSVDTDTDLGATNTSICDKAGRLLMYTNGCSITDGQTHRMVPGSDSLNFPIREWNQLPYSSTCPDDWGLASGPDHYFIPFENYRKIFLYHIRPEFYPAPGGGLGLDYTRLYTELEREADGGYRVLQKDVLIPYPDSLFGGSAAVRVKGATEAWWIITGVLYQNKYYVTLVDSSGPVSTTAYALPEPPHGIGQGFDFMTVSPDGKKIGRRCRGAQLMLYDFDQETGVISNGKELYNEGFDDQSLEDGLTFSPNSQYLYVAYDTKLYQYDMNDSDINAGKELVGEWDGFINKSFRTIFYTMLLGADCRIYINCPGSNEYLHVIEHPDRKGMACGLRQRAIKTREWYRGIMPSIDHFRAGTAHLGPVCDPRVSIGGGAVEETRHFVSPNPASETIQLYHFSEGKVEWHLYTINGREIHSRVLVPGESYHTIEVGTLPSGLYLYRLVRDGWSIGHGKLVVE